MINRRQREARKAELLTIIAQQRLDLRAARQHWLQQTARFDRGWVTFLSLRQYLAVGSGLVAVFTVRNKNGLVRWIKRAFGLWSSWRLLRSHISPR